MDLLSGLSLIVAAIVAFWGIYQTRITRQLQYEVHQLSMQLDQKVRRIDRARELCALLHRTAGVAGHEAPSESNVVEYEVYLTELAGTVDAINDLKLQTIFNDELMPTLAFFNPDRKPEARKILEKLMPVLAHLYKRLNQLPEN